jgi:hypothetical protein
MQESGLFRRGGIVSADFNLMAFPTPFSNRTGDAAELFLRVSYEAEFLVRIAVHAVHVAVHAQLELPWQWLLRRLCRPNVALLAASSLPLRNLSLLHKVSVQAQPQLQREMDRSDGSLGYLQRIKYQNVVAKHIQVI